MVRMFQKIENAQNTLNLDRQRRLNDIGVPCALVARMDGLELVTESRPYGVERSKIIGLTSLVRTDDGERRSSISRRHSRVHFETL
jgi:hypothetical protein